MKDIQITNLCKKFGNHVVFDNLTMTLRGGAVTCLMGKSGYGKTTLLRMIAGLEPVDSGNISGLPDKISFVFQEDRLCEDFNAVSNLRLVLGKGRDNEIKEHLRALGLGEFLEIPIGEYSGGMKRRTAIARAVILAPDLLLLDEPFKGLDEALKKQVVEYILTHTAGKTVLCITHDPEESRLMGGEVIDMEGITHEYRK